MFRKNAQSYEKLAKFEKIRKEINNEKNDSLLLSSDRDRGQ